MPRLLAVGLLGAATFGVTLSNFYGGFIAAVITPVAVAAYWSVRCRTDPRSLRRLGITMASLLVIAGAGIAYAVLPPAPCVANRAAFAFPRADLFLYSAKWWSFLVPPVEHPLLGAHAGRLWHAVGVREGLLEQQVSLGWGIIALGLIAVSRWRAGVGNAKEGAQLSSLALVPVLVVVAVAALVCSLSPERTIRGFTFVRPSALLYAILPMFRSYARFGIVVHLMAALLAGIGVDFLWRAGNAPARRVSPQSRGRVRGSRASRSSSWPPLSTPSCRRRSGATSFRRRPTAGWCSRPIAYESSTAHRSTTESASVEWLTGGRTTLLGGAIGDCAEPNLPQKLAARGYTHLLVRRHAADEHRFTGHPAPDGLRAVARFDDGQVFAIAAHRPAIYTAAMTGFFPREYDGKRSWRWMGADAAWTVVNTSDRPIVATLDLEMASFNHPRRMTLLLDGRPVEKMLSLVVEPLRRTYELGPLTIGSGEHELVFRPAEEPTVAGDVINNGDTRALSFAIGTWNWTVRGERP